MFVDREKEIHFLNKTLQRSDRGQMILLYGRRRVGKTELLRHWALGSGQPYTYWMAEKESPALQRRKLFARLFDVPLDRAIPFDAWSEFWDWSAPRLAAKRQILILDELQYAITADSAMLSALQYAWDHYLQNSPLILTLCGSQVNIMQAIQNHQSPLFGRLTGQWLLQPLPFAALRQFFPNWSAEERVAAYAIVGGVPAYLRWLDPQRNLSGNIRQTIVAPGSMFMSEPALLLYDEVRELAGERADQLSVSLRAVVSLGAAEEDDGRRARIVGSATAVADKINAYREAGLDHLVCYFPAQTEADLLTQLERFASEVRPLL